MSDDKAAPAPHGEPAPCYAAGDPDIIIVDDPRVSVGRPDAPISETFGVTSPIDAPVVVVPPGQSAGVQASRPVDAAAALDVDAPGAGGIMRAIRANRGR